MTDNGKAFIGEDGFWHKKFNGEEFVLADQFHYQSTAIKEAEAYKRSGKITKVSKSPGGLYGVWVLAKPPNPCNPSVSKKAITEAEVEAKAEIARLIRESRSTEDALKSARMELEAIEAELGKRTIPYGGDFYRKRRGKLPQLFPGVPGAVLDVKRTIYKEFIDELEQQLEIPKTRREMLIDYDRGHTLEQLKEMCRTKGLAVSGDKKELIARLI